MSEWKKYEGTDEQRAEMLNAENGFIVRWESYVESLKYSGDCSEEYITDILKDFTHYLICNPHPLANMIAQQARTGQPVWIRLIKPYSINIWEYKDHPTTKLMVDVRGVYLITTTPDWNIPGAEYSFKPFGEEK